MDLGRSWAPLEKGLGRSGPSFGRSWTLLGRFLDVENRTFFQQGSKMGSKRAFGSILGRFWMGLGRVLEGFWEDLGWIFVLSE